ncbi:MAG TPA: hypothetical protein VGH54_09855 [Mycobacterium sp.]|uniref:hypothetical protein n=1 Tax=Mycobacterium sp. TaxID=1785 RepID=UPI002F40DC8B
MSDERVQYDGAELDEILAENVTVHIEGMDAHHWMVRIWRPARWTKGVLTRTAVNLHLSASDVFEVEDTEGLPVIQREAIAWCHEWTDRRGRRHQCYSRPHEEGTRHRCSCGTTTAWEKP